jgi:ComF family protein
MASGRDLPLCRGCQGDLQANTTSCARCALPLSGQHQQGSDRVCGHCLLRPPSFDRVLAPWLYEELLAHLIHRWKFGGEHHLSALLASLWLAANPSPAPLDLLVPVPLHWRRRWQRGYNQAALLGNELKRRCPALDGTAIADNLLTRKRATAAQSGMSALERWRNLQGAFTVRHPCDNLRVAVVDDVLTTGATAAAAASALRGAGAERVEIWCLARTPAENR